MSFGLDIKVDHADGYTTWIEVVDGQTYNLTPMWRRGCAIPEDEGTRWFEDKTCTELQPVLLKAVEDYVVNLREYVALDPPNGWGDHEGYFSTLLRFARLVHEHPTGTVRWNG